METTTGAAPQPARGPADLGAVARAEAALRALSGEFAAWMAEEVARLDAALAALQAAPASPEAWDAMRKAAHDLKGLGTTYGHPLATRACASLGRLIDPPARASTPLPLVAAHVAAVHAVADGLAGAELCAELEARTAAELARRAG